MSKKLIGKARQKSRKKLSNEALKKRAFLDKEYLDSFRTEQLGDAFTINAGKTIPSEVEVIKLKAIRQSDGLVRFEYQPYFWKVDSIRENFVSNYESDYKELLDEPKEEMISALVRGELEELKGLLFLGCGVSEKGIDLPIKLNGVDMMEIVKSSDVSFFRVEKTTRLEKLAKDGVDMADSVKLARTHKEVA